MVPRSARDVSLAITPTSVRWRSWAAGCIVNTGGIVEHDCIVGDCVHVSVNSILAGRSSLGDRVFLGAGAVVIDGISVGSDVTIGAGAVVAESIQLPGIYAGVPARKINL